MPKILFIVNPKAGKANSEKYVDKIISNLNNNGYEVILKYTSLEKDASKIIEENKEYSDIVIVWGGDGTLNEAIIGIQKVNPDGKIAFIPKGTTNDFAHSLKVSFDELDISKNLNNYQVRKIDLGTIDDVPFSYVVSFGIFSKTSYQTSRKLKNIIGKPAYYLNGAKELFGYPKYKLKITYDDEILDDNFIFGIISNSKYVGGFPLFRKNDVKLDDGKFEVTLVKAPKSDLETIPALSKILTGGHNKNLKTFKASKIKIESQDGLDLSVDGEFGGKRNIFTIENHPRKLNFLIP